MQWKTLDWNIFYNWTPGDIYLMTKSIWKISHNYQAASIDSIPVTSCKPQSTDFKFFKISQIAFLHIEKCLSFGLLGRGTEKQCRLDILKWTRTAQTIQTWTVYYYYILTSLFSKMKILVFVIENIVIEINQH